MRNRGEPSLRPPRSNRERVDQPEVQTGASPQKRESRAVVEYAQPGPIENTVC